jgi:uncharacterized protein YndB with AHSA1/START domain
LLLEKEKIKMPKFEREVEINAPVEKVWQVLTDSSHWHQWFPGIDSVSNATSISAGGSFDWVSKGQTGQGTITKMEPMKHLEIRTQLGNDKDAHVFVLKPSGGFFGLRADETKVTYTLDTLAGGGILGNFVMGGNPADMLRVKNATNLLRKLVESL